MTSQRLVVCASHSPGKERDVEHAFGRRFRSALTAAAERVQRFDPDPDKFAFIVKPLLMPVMTALLVTVLWHFDRPAELRSPMLRTRSSDRVEDHL